jgi:hypothetical protein
MNSETPQTGAIDNKPKSKRPGKLDPVDILVFLIPFLQFANIRVIGTLTGSDVLFLLSFIYLASRLKLRVSTPLARKFIVLCLLWLSSQIATDLIRHTMFIKIARSWSSISVTLVAFTVLFTLLYGRPRRIMIYGWGCALGSTVAFFVSPNDFATEYPWKFGIGWPVTLAVVLLASRKECRGYLPIQLLTIIGIVNVSLGARSMGEVCLAAAMFILITRRVHKKKSTTLKLQTRTKVAIAISLLLGGVGLAWAYQYVAGHGMLGEVAQTKFNSQSAGKYGFLLGGRTEILGSLPAIYDSPLIGHGSQAADPKYVMIMQESLALLGYDEAAEGLDQDVKEGSDAIPVHSYLFGAWVWAGLLGAVFWVWVWSVAARALFRVYPRSLYILPLVAYCAFGLLWDILFSPYGTLGRVFVPYYVVTFMSCLEIVPREKPKVSGALVVAHS